MVHLLIIIVLGIWMLIPKTDDGVQIESKFIAEEEGDQFEDDTVDLKVEDPVDFSVLTPESPVEVDDPFAAPPDVPITLDGSSPTSDIKAPQIGMALNGRSEGMKRALLKAYGGTETSERAVQLALDWLARNQQQDGSWNLTGPFSDGGARDNPLAATAMALLAFQGAGHTHKQGKYQKNVDRGMKFLLKRQDEQRGAFTRGVTTHEQFYTHGQCSIAVCELYAMTGDAALKSRAELAIKFCVDNQDPRNGGWRCSERDDSDTSVTGWILMAMQSAKMAGLEVPQTTLDNIGKYLDTAQVGGSSRYSYIPGASPTEVMTAEALLCRQYLGWARDDPNLKDGVDYLLTNLPDWHNNRNVYYWYYATQVMHHMEGEPWKKWNASMRDLLVSKQQTTGKERGSWHPTGPDPDQWGAHGGRLYTTCLSVFILEVYYRHLPIYSKVRLN